MALIKLLSEKLINQIAAGEVVERPASVIKELVENSLDARADNISIEINDGGKSLIRIVDNGFGMSREDCELSLQRHATSKISEEMDLWKISTMGFRGEALASIASVSQMILKSKTAKDISGTQIETQGGEIKNISEVGMSAGTQIEVRNLFFNTPARQKYLKQESTELSHITALINSLALANPSIAFKLIHNGKMVLDLARSNNFFARITDLFGKNTAEAMLPIFYGGSEFQLDGFIGKPLLSRSSGAHQYIFVNGRTIQHHVLAHRIKAAYHSMLMENKKPVFILNLKIDPGLIDVNVHPRKTEIRFEDQETVLRIIYGAVKTALEKNSLMPKGFSESQRYMSDKWPVDVPQIPAAKSSSSDGFSIAKNFPGKTFDRENSFQEALIFTENFTKNREAKNLEEFKASMTSISQIANSYIVAENEEGLVLIDQHAAHERVRYEELMDQFENQNKAIQPLLVTLQMELSRDEVILIEENLTIFESLGFEIENFGGNTFIINAVPSFLAKEDIENVIRGVLDDILENKKPGKAQGRIEEMLTYMSCRSAIKFGQKLSFDEMQSLIKQMDKCKRPYTCPHGRPTMISLTLSELEKMFGRK